MRVLGGLPERGDDISGTLQFATADARTRQPPRAARISAWRGCRHADPAPLNPHASVLSQLAARAGAQARRAARTAPPPNWTLALGTPRRRAVHRRCSKSRRSAIAPRNHCVGIVRDRFCADARTCCSPIIRCRVLPPLHARMLVRGAAGRTEAAWFCHSLCRRPDTETAALLGGRLIVMRHGRVVEEGPFARLATSQAHAYTQTLVQRRGWASRRRRAMRAAASRCCRSMGWSFPRARSKTRARTTISPSNCGAAHRWR